MEMLQNYCRVCGQIKGGVAKTKGINHDKCNAILKTRKKGKAKKKANYSESRISFLLHVLDGK